MTRSPSRSPMTVTGSTGWGPTSSSSRASAPRAARVWACRWPGGWRDRAAATSSRSRWPAARASSCGCPRWGWPNRSETSGFDDAEMDMRRSAIAVAATLLALTAGDPAGAADRVLRPTADLYVSARHPERNYGGATRLVIARRPASRAFVRFQPGVPPRGSRIVLYVYPLRDSAAGLTLRHASDRPWAERRITLRTAPRTGPRVVRTGPLRAQRWKPIDVTRLAGTSGVAALALSAAGPGRVEIASREV